jgi:predicted TIM-barrel fold metal-dependent hydrolase
MFANAGFGWHIETAVHALRIVLGGVSDRFPKLQLILGHLGETLPFMIQRVDNMTPGMTGLKNRSAAICAIIYITLSVVSTRAGVSYTPSRSGR